MALFVFFEVGRTPLDRLIQLVSVDVGHARHAPKPTCNHAGFFRIWSQGASLYRQAKLFEATPLRAHIGPATEKLGHYLRVYQVTDLSIGQEEAIWYDIRAHDHEWYDLLSPIQAATWCWAGHSARFLRDPRIGFDCVQSVAERLRAGGVPFCGERPAASLTPAVGETHCVDAGWPLVTLGEILAPS